LSVADTHGLQAFKLQCNYDAIYPTYTGWAKLSDTTLHFCLQQMSASTKFYDFWHK